MSGIPILCSSSIQVFVTTNPPPHWCALLLEQEDPEVATEEHHAFFVFYTTPSTFSHLIATVHSRAKRLNYSRFVHVCRSDGRSGSKIRARRGPGSPPNVGVMSVEVDMVIFAIVALNGILSDRRTFSFGNNAFVLFCFHRLCRVTKNTFF